MEWISCADSTDRCEVQGPGEPRRYPVKTSRSHEVCAWYFDKADDVSILGFSVIGYEPKAVVKRSSLKRFARKEQKIDTAGYHSFARPPSYKIDETKLGGLPAFEIVTFTPEREQLRRLHVYTPDFLVRLEMVWQADKEPLEIWEKFKGSLKFKDSKQTDEPKK